MASDFDIHIGTRELWGGGTTPFGLNVDDVFQHVWLNGQTGVGKSALMRSMFAQTIANGHGCTLIDLNGDLSNEVLDDIPLARRNDVVICDPSDADHVLPINPFYKIPIDKRAIVAADFTEACRHIWADSWGERMDWILYNVVAAILHAPENLRPTILSIPALLTVQHYREQIIKHVHDVEVVRFFEHEFDRYSANKRSEFIMPIENKIGKIIANPFVHNVLAPYRSSFQFNNAIRGRTIVIVRLPKGTIGSTPAKLLGSLVVSTIINAALEQADLDYDDRVPHFLFIDEQHNLNTTALTSAYSELRKYKLGIISSTQYTDQMPDDVLKSMFGNIGTIIAFRSSANDAHRFEHQIGEFPAHQYTQLGLGQVRVRLIASGSPKVPFRATTDIEHIIPVNKSDQIRRYNRERYTKPRTDVEHDYGRWIRKLLTDPAVIRAQRHKIAEKRKQRTVRPVTLPSSQAHNGTISERGQTALKNIKSILQKAERRKPTRRRKRRPTA